MKLIDEIKRVNDAGSGVHMPHIYVGDPSIEFTEAIIETFAINGGDIIEIGIPFSDPVADGATFQGVCERALSNGIKPNDCLNLIKRFKEKDYLNPVVLTTYYNIPFNMGIMEFARQAKEVGVQGVIIPDMPVEESTPILEATKKNGIDLIFQVAPTTTDDRLKLVANLSESFLYVINVEGVTGSRDIIHRSTVELLKRVREYSDLPLLAGFGVSNGEHARVLTEAGADGVVAGSVYTNLYMNSHDPMDALKSIAEKVKEIKSGCNFNASA